MHALVLASLYVSLLDCPSYRVVFVSSRARVAITQWAADLEALCLETADERTCLEATAYSAWMSGNLLLEREAWRDALDRYSTADRICKELGKVGSSFISWAWV